MNNENNRNAKGKGKYTSRHLSATEKVNLMRWMDNNKEICHNLSAEELSFKFKDDTQIDVGISSILTMRHAVFPEMKRTHQPRIAKNDYTEIVEKINQLHRRIARIESELHILTL